MPIFLKKLNCFMACVVKNEDEVKYLLPIVLQKNKNWPTILKTFCDKEEDAKYFEKYSETYCEYFLFDDHYYKFIIEDYGFLILGRKKPFEKFFKFELTPVINFLGKSLMLAVERKKLEDSEKQIYREKQLLKTIIDNIPIHIYAEDLETKRILSNKTEINYLGLESEEEVVSKTESELFQEIKDRSNLIDNAHIFQGNKVINQEVSHIKNNDKSWFLQSKIPLKNEDGGIIGLVGIAINITKQKKVEDQLRQLDLENKKVIKSLKENEKYLKSLNLFASKILKQNTIEEIIWEVTDNLIEEVGVTDCIIYLFDNNKENLVQRAAYGPKQIGAKIIKNPIVIPIGEGIVGSVAQSKNSEIIDDTSLDQRYILDSEIGLSEITVPIIADGEVIGVIDSEHPERNYYSKIHLEKFQTIANLTSSRLKNALYQEKLLIAQKSILKLSTAVELSSLSIAIMGIDSSIEFVNPAFEKLSGYSEQEILGKKINILKSGEHSDAFYNQIWKTVLNGDKWTGEILNKKKHGNTFWALMDISPIIDGKGVITNFVALQTDITKQKEIEKVILESNRQLKLQEEKYRNIISNMNLGLLEVDLDDTIQFCNQSFEEALGYTLDEIAGKKAKDLLLSKEFADLIAQKRDDRITDKSDSYEILAKDKSGNLRWLLISGAPNYNEQGEIIGSIGIHLDITAQKKLEKDLEKALLESQKTSEAKELFLANMSHEIRTPLSGIIGMIRELDREQMPFKQKGYVNRAMKASKHLLSVVNNILDITKIEAGEYKMKYNHFNLQELLNDIILILKPQSDEKNIDLELDIHELVSPIFIGDESRIRQVLINIAGNSIKFTEKGKVVITCSTKSKFGSLHTICLGISDTGIGMSKNYLKVLFKKFQQEDSSTSRKYEGTGLGMFISKQLVDLMGGNIEVKSEKGIGSEFKVYIPLTKGAISKVEKKQTKNDNKILTNARILLVEDNEINRYVASNTLNIWNVDLTEAVNGIEAIEILKKESFNIILMDIQMAEMNGIEATKIIRNEMNIQIPIIALSANAFKSEIDNCLSIGMDDYITKPFEEQDLFNVLIKHMNRKHNLLKNKKGVTGKKYDLAKLNEMSRGNQEFVEKMLQLFVDNIPVSINKMNEMLINNDIEGVKKIAHKIKPSLLNMGIVILKKDILEIEKFNQKEMSLQTLTELVGHVTQVLKGVILEIKEVELRKNI